MTTRTILPGWTIDTWSGAFEPMACGPHDICLTVGDDDTITVHHTADYDGPAYVKVPILWVTEAVAETLAYRASKGKP